LSGGVPVDQLDDGDSRYCTVQHVHELLFPALSKGCVQAYRVGLHGRW